MTACYGGNGKMVFDQSEIEEAVLNHFGTLFHGKREPLPKLQDLYQPQTDSILQEIDQILSMEPDPPYTASDKYESEVCMQYMSTELTQILHELPDGKASGYDRIPNELLKNASCSLKQYLMIMLNKILDEGEVPPAMNLGKCILIHKVSNDIPI